MAQLGKWTVAVFGACLPALALAGDADPIVAEMDKATNQAKDLTIEWSVLDQEPGKKEPRTMEFTVKLKGAKTLTEFEAPGDLKGTRVLVVARDEMYIWLPSFGKVRRIASHVTQQGFMGTSYSNEDLNASRFGDVYEGKVLSQDADKWTVELKPRAGEVNAPYPMVQITLQKSNHIPVQIKYFNESGTLLKTEDRSEFHCEGTICIPGTLKMTDHSRNGAWTQLHLEKVAIDTGIADDTFEVRYLPTGY